MRRMTLRSSHLVRLVSRRSPRLGPVLCALLGLAGGCTPELGEPPSLVSGRRVLAVRGEPAEAMPGATVQFTILVATPAGTTPDEPVEWGFCKSPKPLSENNSVSRECLAEGTEPIAAAPSVSAPLPNDGCARFGPDTPPSPPGQPPLRPRDPDVTGGYYQPVRALLQAASGTGEQVSFGLERIRCNLAGAPIEVAQEFRRRYLPNQNPALLEVRGSVGGGAFMPLVREGEGVAPGRLGDVPAEAEVVLEARWDGAAAEGYPVYDPTSRALVDRREALRVSWYATAGTLAHDRSGRGEDDPETTAENIWIAPRAAGLVYLWAVLRDSRGGVSWAAFVVDVR